MKSRTHKSFGTVAEVKEPESMGVTYVSVPGISLGIGPVPDLHLAALGGAGSR